MKYFYITLTILLTSCLSEKETYLSLNNLFQDNMVMQHESVVPVWGLSKSNKEVKIVSSWDEEITTISDSNGYWKVNINTPKADNIFHKIIISRDGKVFKTFSSMTNPTSSKFIDTIEELIR